MVTLTEAQAAQSMALTLAFKAQENREAAKVAALIALYYSKRVDPTSLESVDNWLDLVIPSLIRRSDAGANSASRFFTIMRQIELGVNAPTFNSLPALGIIDPGVRKSLLAVGPYDYMNKASEIRSLDIGPQQKRAMLVEAKQATTKALGASSLRHAQAGSRQTIYDNAARDQVALGYIRVTKEDPCYFCQALASRGLRYRAFGEGSFDMSNARFSGDGDAKVHDNCGCSLKAVYSKEDAAIVRNQTAADQWARWGAGGGDAMLRFRRGYEHLQKTGEYLDFDVANEGLRAA